MTVWAGGRGGSSSCSTEGYAEYLEELDRRVVLGSANCTTASDDGLGCIRERILFIFQERHLDAYMAPLIQAIRNSSPLAAYQARNAISLVQRIPYGIAEARLDLPHENRSMNRQNLYYPYEVLYHGEGLCIDKSILLAYILDRLGYDVVIFLFPPTHLWPEGHAAVGVRTSERYDFFDTGYAFIESTNVTIPTYYPETYGDSFRITSHHTIVKVGSGTGALDLSMEYSDARELEGMLETGIQDHNQYMRFRALIEKYGLN